MIDRKIDDRKMRRQQSDDTSILSIPAGCSDQATFTNKGSRGEHRPSLIDTNQDRGKIVAIRVQNSMPINNLPIFLSSMFLSKLAAWPDAQAIVFPSPSGKFSGNGVEKFPPFCEGQIVVSGNGFALRLWRQWSLFSIAKNSEWKIWKNKNSETNRHNAKKTGSHNESRGAADERRSTRIRRQSMTRRFLTGARRGSRAWQNAKPDFRLSAISAPSCLIFFNSGLPGQNPRWVSSVATETLETKGMPGCYFGNRCPRTGANRTILPNWQGGRRHKRPRAKNGRVGPPLKPSLNHYFIGIYHRGGQCIANAA
jgi:hypothetical protein